jgi:hypothetical protein
MKTSERKRAYAREYRRAYYTSHGDEIRAKARDYSRRRYHGMTSEQRKAFNRRAWARWGRRAYLRRIAAENRRRYPPETDPDRVMIRNLSAAQDAETARILRETNSATQRT